MDYLVFDNSDLELVLEFAAELWADGEVIKLLNLLQEKIRTCGAFDEQHIP